MPGKTAGAACAGEALIARHAELQAVLGHWAGVLAAAADSGGPVRPVRNLLRAFLADEVLLPHARAEERTLYRAAKRDPGTSLPVQALISEHRDLAARAATLGESAPPAATAAQAAAISALFASHVANENYLPPGTPSGHEPARNGPAGCEDWEHPARWPSLTTAPHSSQTRQAQQAGSPPSAASLDPAGDRARVVARRGSVAGASGLSRG